MTKQIDKKEAALFLQQEIDKIIPPKLQKIMESDVSKIKGGFDIGLEYFQKYLDKENEYANISVSL